MRILVLGGAGYTGSVLTRSLLERGDTVTVFDTFWFGDWLDDHQRLTKITGDIRSLEVLPSGQYDACIHLANIANDPGVELSPVLSWEVNALGSQLVAEFLTERGIPRLIFASSGSVYGIKDEPAVTEDLQLLPISAYNKTKMVAERIFMSYSDVFLTHIVRPATVCGVSPRMRFDLTVNMLTLDALTKGVITVYGGQQLRPNIHVQDLVRVYLHILDNPQAAPKVLNAGFENLSVKQIAERIVAIVPSKVKVEESTDPRSYSLDSSKLVQSGFSPLKTVEDAVLEVADFVKRRSDYDRGEWRTVQRLKQLGLSEDPGNGA